jgi:hypothetical protein
VNPHVDNFWAHLEIVAAVLIPIALAWLQTRRENKRQWEESARLQQTLHVENVTRLTAIETKIDPLWSWWNRSNGGQP